MKKVALIMGICLTTILSFTACEKETILIVDQTPQIIPATGGTVSVSLTTNKSWSATSNQTWCKISPSSGEEAANTRVTISCDANASYDERSCTVTFTCAELTKTVTVSQSMNNGLQVSQTSFALTKAAQQVSIEVMANVKFSVEVDSGCKDWVKYHSTKGLNASTVVLDIAENKTYDMREGKVTIRQDDGSLSSTITLKQSQLDGLFLTTSEYSLSNEKHTLAVEIQSNIDFEVKPEVDWIKYVETKGLNTNQIILNIAANESYDAREGKVLVKQKNGGLTGTITIRQDEKSGILVSQQEYDLTSEAQTINVEVKYNVDFDVIVSDDSKGWIQQVSTKALDNRIHSFIIARNDSYDPRAGSITFKQKNGPLSGTVSVRQSQKDGLIAAQSTYEISGESQVLTIDIQANVAYEAISEAAWIKVVRTKGLKTSQLTLEVAENEDENIREGFVTVKQENGVLSERIRIIQGKNRFVVEREALIAFYQAMNGPNWSDNTNWCSDKPVSEWVGIYTYNSWNTPEKNGLVNQIFLPGIGVSGDLEQAVEALAQLKYLEKLCLQGNPLNCPIPSNIARLKSLTGISLWESKIIGTLPEELGELENLEYLDLFDNWELTGPIPATLGNLKKAKWINLSNCNLTGNIPEEITHLNEMEFPFDCWGNSQLVGTVPAAFSQWKYWNDFWGHIVHGTKLTLEDATPSIPAFSVTLPDGTQVKSDIVKDHKLTILFQWATWCRFSAEFLPILKSAYKHFEKEGLAILSWADDDEPEDKILKYAAENGIVWPNFIAECGKNQIKSNLLPRSDKNASYPYSAYPSINAFDSNGKLVYTNANSNQMETFVPFMDAWFDSDWDGSDVSAYESTDYSKDGHVTKIQTATKGNGIDIVFVGDAYSDRLVNDGTYATQVFRAMEAFFSMEPYKSMREYFNVFAIDAISKQEFLPGETALMTNWTGGNPVVFSGNHAKAMQYARNAVGDEKMDDALIIVLLNLDLNGGTCHMFYCPDGDYGRGVTVSYVPTFSEGDRFSEIVVHEAGGHGFAKLADEYTLSLGAIPQDLADAYQADAAWGWWKNVDFTSDPNQIKWAPFIGDSRFSDEEIGVYQGGLTYDWGVYRPTRNSVMNGAGEFNAPSRYAIWYRINKLAYGPEWSGSFEDFAAFDVAHRQQVSSKAAAGTRSNSVEKIASPLAQPVLHPDFRLEHDHRE